MLYPNPQTQATNRDHFARAHQIAQQRKEQIAAQEFTLMITKLAVVTALAISLILTALQAKADPSAADRKALDELVIRTTR